MVPSRVAPKTSLRMRRSWLRRRVCLRICIGTYMMAMSMGMLAPIHTVMRVRKEANMEERGEKHDLHHRQISSLTQELESMVQ